MSYLAAAYGVVLLSLGVYAFHLGSERRRLRKEDEPPNTSR